MSLDTTEKTHLVGVCDTANFGIDPIPSKYRASIADTDFDICHLKKTYI